MVLRFAYEPNETGRNRFVCFGTDAHSDYQIIAHVNNVQLWIEERGECIRLHKYALVIDDPDLAMEFKLRWC